MVINMQYLIRGLSLLILPIIVSGVLAFLKMPRKAEKGKVYLPKFFLILGLIISTLFLIPTAITAFSGEDIWLPIMFFIFSLIGSIFIIAFINCRIFYDNDGFTAKSFFGISRKYSYDQITGIKENMHEDYIYLGKRRVMVDEVAVGGIEFLAFANQKYKKLHEGKPIPRILKTKHSIFNGNVNDEAGFIFVYILLSVVVVAFAAFIVYHIYFNTSSADNTVKQDVLFISCVNENDELVLMSADNKIYKLRLTGNWLDTEKISSVCDGKTNGTVYSKKYTPDDAEDYYAIKAICRGDDYILSFEETDRLHREEFTPLIWFPIVFALFFGAFVAGSIIVGRNPKRFSKKIVSIFFRDGYVRY